MGYVAVLKTEVQEEQQSLALNEEQVMALYMQIGSYEGKINRYANPQSWGKWDKYTRLKRKILQWQQNI